jgi:hypothetical protein
MSDPRRLLEEGDLGASLLTAALVLDAEEARARKAALLGVAASGTAVIALGAAAKVLPKSFAAALFTKSMVVGVVVAVVSGGAVGAIALTRSERSAAAPSLAATSRHTLRAEGGKAPPASVEASSAAPQIDRVLEEASAPSPLASAVDPPPIAPRAAPSASAVGARSASSPRPAQRDEAPADAASSCHLAEEVALLQEARSALVQGQPARALAALDAHAQRCPHGSLGIEAEVLRIEALSRSGNASAAKARAERFIALHPGTPYAARVQALSGEAPANP